MRQFDEADTEGADLRARDAALARLDHAQLDAMGVALFLQLAADQAGRERRRIQRHAQVFGEIGQCADVVFMPVRQDDTDEIVQAILDEGQVGQDDIDAGICGIGEGHAQIDHQPLAGVAIEIDVHADLARAAEGAEEKFVGFGSH